MPPLKILLFEVMRYFRKTKTIPFCQKNGVYLRAANFSDVSEKPGFSEKLGFSTLVFLTLFF